MALPSQDKFVLRQLTDSQVPSGLRGPFIVDDRYNLPRYWATVDVNGQLGNGGIDADQAA